MNAIQSQGVGKLLNHPTQEQWYLPSYLCQGGNKPLSLRLHGLGLQLLTVGGILLTFPRPSVNEATVTSLV